MKENTCCEKCEARPIRVPYLVGGDGGTIEICINRNCPCHQPPTEEKSPLHCRCTETSVGHLRGCLEGWGGKVAPKDSLEWEESWTQELREVLRPAINGGERFKNLVTFIKQQITKAKEEERARIRGVIESLKRRNKEARPENLLEQVDERAYDAALTDILKEIGE